MNPPSRISPKLTTLVRSYLETRIWPLVGTPRCGVRKRPLTFLGNPADGAARRRYHGGFCGLATLLPNFFYRHDNVPIFKRDVSGRGKFISGPAGTNFLDREVNGSVTNGELER